MSVAVWYVRDVVKINVFNSTLTYVAVTMTVRKRALPRGMRTTPWEIKSASATQRRRASPYGDTECGNARCVRFVNERSH